ncbi:MAG TPA: hypothetical protein VIG08_07210 [Gemmatimonadales bacterium]|jgi:hypothetical protein
MGRQLARTGRLFGVVAGASVLLGLTHVATQWAGYGRRRRRPPKDPLLDRFMPTYEVAERHETMVRAPAACTFAVARELDLRESSLIRAIFATRELIMRSSESGQSDNEPFLTQVLRLGWAVLAEEPDRQIVLGAVTRPWEGDVKFRGLQPDEFVKFCDPGYAKIVWTIAVEPRGPTGSVFRTETRVATTDPKSRERFRRYWAVFSAGIILIRRETLRLVKREAEQRADWEAVQIPSELIGEDLHLLGSGERPW